MAIDWIVFVAGAALAIFGALGVILVKNPVHSALLLVMTLFGVAVLFVTLEAHFIAVVQVIVYAGAIVVLFLFVIMLLGVDRTTDELRTETLKGQRPAALIVGALALVELILVSRINFSVGRPSLAGSLVDDQSNVEQLGRSVFTQYLFAFEITSRYRSGGSLYTRRPTASFDRRYDRNSWPNSRRTASHSATGGPHRRSNGSSNTDGGLTFRARSQKRTNSWLNSLRTSRHTRWNRSCADHSRMVFTHPRWMGCE